jgi:hypothetical protein
MSGRGIDDRQSPNPEVRKKVFFTKSPPLRAHLLCLEKTHFLDFFSL